MAQYVDIMTDAGFKAVFQDKQVTIKFLNAALAGERQIKDITYLDKEIKPEIVENRTIIFDLLCEDEEGYLILDYKYSSHDAARMKEDYAPQIDLYRKAVARIKGVNAETIRARLINILGLFEVKM